MKKPIGLLLVLVLLSTNLFAATPAKITMNKKGQSDAITFATLPSRKGVSVTFKKGTKGKAVVIIYDSHNTPLRKDILSDPKSLEKGYVVTSLEDGDYTIEVTLNKTVMKKNIHVYMEDQVKTFLIKS
jgi:hypothetical protein